MRELFTEIEINASPESVWRVLVDFNEYPAWNPFIRNIEGALEEGRRLKVRIEPPGGSAMTFKPVVKKVTLNHEIRWLGHLFIPGLFDGEHRFEIRMTDDTKLRFVQREAFGGLLVPILWKSLKGATQKGFEAMNAALKQRAESLFDNKITA